MTMTSTFHAALVAGLVLASCAAFAGPKYPNNGSIGEEANRASDWYRQCMRVEHATPPASDLTARRAGKCNATAMYYDKRSQAVTSAAEWNKVRECALTSSDNGVLMMLHANGYGVAKNPDLAIKYACSLDGAAVAEMEARVGHLASGSGANTGKPFDLCDDITSGYMGAVCSSISERQNGKVRAARLARYERALPPTSKPAFKTLQAAADAWALKRQDEESDMQGTAAAGLAIDSGEHERELFLDDLLGLSSAKLPQFTAADYSALDADLNRSYQALLATPSKQKDQEDRIGDSTVTRTGVRATERAWLAYRNAWAAYLTATPSPVDPASIQALLTQRRIKQLSRIAY